VSRDKKPTRQTFRPYQPKPFGRIYLALLGGGFALAIGLYFALSISQGIQPLGDAFNAPVSAARIEILKLALAATAGVAAVAGLYVAYRKQRNEEASAIREQDKVFTERFTAASQLLQSDKAAVRLAGLNALARLADDSLRDRPTCLETICSYLRLPLEVPSFTTERPVPPSSISARDLGNRQFWPDPSEWEVRRSGLTLITTRLGRSVPEIYWSNCRVDLRDSVLIDLDLTDCDIDGPFDASGALICSSRVMHWGNLTARAEMSFIGAQFTNSIHVADTLFNGRVYCFVTTFHEPLTLTNVEFSEHLSMGSSQVASVDFKSVKFGEYTAFNAMQVKGSACFCNCDLQESNPIQGALTGPKDSAIPFVDLQGATLDGLVKFENCHLPPIISFNRSTITGRLVIDDTVVYLDIRGVNWESISTDSEIVPQGALIDGESKLPPQSSFQLPNLFPFTTPRANSDGYWSSADAD
jgi:hypothetical protein